MVIGYEKMNFFKEYRTYHWKKFMPFWLLSIIPLGILIGGSFFGFVRYSFTNFQSVVENLDSSLLRIISFTFLQGFLSTLFSIIPAIFLSRALFRHPKFPGRAILLQFFALSISIPSIIIVMSILAIFGRNSLFAYYFFKTTHLQWHGIYGLSGILIGHVIFNIPLATRLFLESLNAIPENHWRISNQLGMNAKTTFFLIEWPAFRKAIPSIASLLFMFCITSFSIVLILGGKPSNITLEVAIYHALKFDFNIERSVVLSAIQILFVFITTIFIHFLDPYQTTKEYPNLFQYKKSHPHLIETSINFFLITFFSIFLLSPIIVMFIQGLSANFYDILSQEEVRVSIYNSFFFALLSAICTIILSWPLVIFSPSFNHQKETKSEPFFQAISSVLLAIPPIIIATGWFILLPYEFIDMNSFVPFMIIVTNTMLCIPFVIRILRPSYSKIVEYDHLSIQLNIQSYKHLQWIAWPIIKKPIISSFLFAMALSFSNFSISALFNSDNTKTLTFLLFSRMGSYRTKDAEGLALLLGVSCLLLMFLADYISKERDTK